jgi:hypothetical protein
MRPTAYSVTSNTPNRNQPTFKVGKDGKRRIETANVKALRDLQVGLVNNARFGKMVMYSIECVGKMAVDQTTVEEIAESGCIEASLNACMTNAKNEQRQNQVNKTILKSAKINQECCVTISQTIGQDFAAFKNSIDTHSSDETLQSTAEVLRLLATAPEPEGQKNRDALRAQGLYESIAKKIASGSITDPKTIAALTQVLATGADAEPTAQMIIDQGVFQRLMDDIKRNPNSLELAQAFAALASSASRAGPNIIAQLKSLGVPQVLSEILTRFPHDKAILKSITEAMGGLSTSTEVAPLMAILKDTNAKNADGLSDEDLLRQKLAASARLAMMTMVKSNLAYFKGGNGIGDVIASYNALIHDLKHYTSPSNLNSANPLQVPSVLLEAITQTSMMLANISKNGAETQRYAVLTAGGVDALKGALQALRAEFDLAKTRGDFRTQARCVDGIAAAISALTALMSRKENVQFLEQNGAIQAALHAAKGFLDKPAVRDAVFAMINRSMDYFEELTPATLRSMLNTLLELIKSGILPDEAQAAELIAKAFVMLAYSEDAEKEIIQAGGIPYLLQLLELFPEDEAVVMEVLRALELALQTQEGMDAFIKAGGEEILKKLRQLHKDNPDMCALIDSILQMCKDYRNGKGIQAHQRNVGDITNGHVSTISQAQDPTYIDPTMMLSGLIGQLSQPPLPVEPVPRRMGMNDLMIEDEEQQRRKQGMNSLSIEDQQVAEGLDLMQQLRAFGLGAGLGAEMVPLGMGSMGQNLFGNIDDYTTSTVTTTTLLEPIQNENSLQAQHLLTTINQVQLYITERRAAKLLSLFESLFSQEQSYDRDYLLNAVLDGLAAICEEGFECEQIILQNNGAIPFEVQPYVNILGYSNVLNELEQGLIENRVGQRLSQRALGAEMESDLAVLSDNLATLLSLITRDCVTLIHVKFGLKPQINPNVETDGQPYQSSNPFLSINARKYAVHNASVGFDEAYADLMEQRELERQQMALQRQVEIERLKKLTVTTMSKENEMVLARIEKAKQEAHEKATKMKEEMQARLDKARKEQEEKMRILNEQAETRRQQQIDSILSAARAATLAKVELEKRIADGETGKPQPRTRDDILRRLDEKTKNFLITGQLITKHNISTGPSGRHFYTTPNLEYIVYRNAGNPEIKKSQMMKLTRFQGVKQGPVCKDLESVRQRVDKERAKNDKRLAQGKSIKTIDEEDTAPQFEVDPDWDDDRIDLPGMHKESMWHGAIPRRATMGEITNQFAEADDEEIPTQYGDSPYFVLVGIDHSGKEREIGFECETVDICKKIVRAYTRLYEYAQTLNDFQGDDTMQMHSNPLHNITQAEIGLSKLVANEQEKSERIHEWKTSQGIIGPNKKQPTFEDLLGNDDPWA